jgi:predicted alpha-1,2-mannosidase
MRVRTHFLCIVFFSLVLWSQERLTNFVDPFIGTGGHGHVYPGATVPFGMVQLSPDNGTEGWDWSSGYHYSDTVIKGFSHTHLSGTGIGDLCDILFMPAVLKDPNGRYSSHFSHNQETAEPGYYSVELKTPNIRVELTATERAGFHRYTFPPGDDAKIIIDLGHRINWDSSVESNITVVSPTLVTGYRYSKGWAPKQRIYFAAHFSQPMISSHLGNDSVLYNGKSSHTEKGAKAIFGFKMKIEEQILVKVGISAVSIDGALHNLDAEITDWDFDRIKKDASDKWEKQLQKIVVTTQDINKKRIFYTALYRTMLAPIIYQDADGRYRGGDDSVHTAKDFVNHTIFSLWDTYRAAHPLFTITQPEKVNDFVNSMLAFKREYGYLPVWTLHGNETMCMIGYHSIPVIADAYLKGFRKYVAEEAFDAMKKSAMSDIMGLQWYRQYGYVPSDREVESVSKTLEYAYDDWCIARVAKAMGKESDYRTFLNRSMYFKNIFDTTTLFMRGKETTGAWRIPFDPYTVDHRNNDYTEGNAWQYSWYVPHDVASLIRLNGGERRFIARLDSLFEQGSQLKGTNVSPDVSGLIGQYAHGNEPSHHIAYLYNYAGAPWKTQQRVAEIMNTMYKNAPDGLSGNEDCGQMSAWYVFSAMGLYPVNPAEQVYAIGTPLYERIDIRLENGSSFVLIAPERNDSTVYIKSAILNGVLLEHPFVSHADIVNGGKLYFEMSKGPTNWGSGFNEAIQRRH